MTFLDENQSPVRSRSPSWCELRKRYYQKRCFQKRYLCFWIFAALFPFMLLRLVFFYSLSSDGTSGGSSEEVRTEELVLRRRASLMSASLPPGGHDVTLSIMRQPSMRQVDAGSLDSQTATGDKVKGAWGDHERPGIDGGGPSTKSGNGEKEKQFRSVIREVVDYGLPEDNENEDPMEWIMAQKEKLQDKKRGQSMLAADDREGNMGVEDGAQSGAEEQIADVQGDANELRVSEEEVYEMWAREQQDSGMNDQKGGGDALIFLKDRETEDRSFREAIDDRNGDAKHGDDAARFRIQRVWDSTNAQDRDETTASAGECDLFDGEWERDPQGPLYTNSSCFYMQVTQNCMSNGRPDDKYLFWKWKPRDCDLPRFDAPAFLEAFRGKAIGFVGDSLARNQMQSLLCMLSQVEIPIQTYQSRDDNTVRWLYRQYGVNLAVVWSPYLLKESSEGVMGYKNGESVLYVNELDTFWTSEMQDFDIIVFSVGQWYFKPSVYVKQGEVIGCHYCPNLTLTEVPLELVYRDAIRQVLEKVAAEFKGTAIMSSFAISHFENGTWSEGGQCRREEPLSEQEGKKFRGYHDVMRDILTDELSRVANDNSNLKLEFLDVTKMSILRADGHPGPYRQRHPFEGKRSDEWVPNDCLHWCLPGPVDTWNQLLVKLAQKHF